MINCKVFARAYSAGASNILVLRLGWGVIAYNEYAQSLKQLDRKIAGIEMEAVGIATACLNRCDFLVVKSISDWADETKGDELHSHCMRVSADLVISLIENEVI